MIQLAVTSTGCLFRILTISVRCIGQIKGTKGLKCCNVKTICKMIDMQRTCATTSESRKRSAIHLRKMIVKEIVMYLLIELHLEIFTIAVSVNTSLTAGKNRIYYTLKLWL